MVPMEVRDVNAKVRTGQAFTRAMGFDMQSNAGVAALKTVVDAVAPVFPDAWFHLGGDEVRLTHPGFMAGMTDYIRGKGKEAVVWHPGGAKADGTIAMCWGENEEGAKLDRSRRFIDCNGFYMDWMDAQSGVYQIFFQQPCEQPEGDATALGAVMPVWFDGALSGEPRVLEQYPFYPCALTFAERVWRGRAQKQRQYMAQLPAKGSAEWREFSEFETRLIRHRDRYFQELPFAYVRQADVQWRLIGPFDHRGRNDAVFPPEREILPAYTDQGKTLQWLAQPVSGGAIHIRHFFTMFNMHRKRYRLNYWPTAMSEAVGKGGGTCYALTYVHSPVEQEVFLMFGANGMWGHSGGYRSARAPEQGSWDFSGGDVWVNDLRIDPPHWPFKSLPWTGWGKGRIEEAPLTWEGYFFRPPVKLTLHKGMNKILVKSVFGHWKGDDGERKWCFCCIPVLWDGRHYREVPGLEYAPSLPAEREK
jgi:hypothetical protein